MAARARPLSSWKSLILGLGLAVLVLVNATVTLAPYVAPPMFRDEIAWFKLLSIGLGAIVAWFAWRRSIWLLPAVGAAFQLTAFLSLLTFLDSWRPT